ncbi:DUF1592 domain-containing protein [Akkermansiaceae bacterium]|nr:DUF1592 domain-containing protein [Akkermansiaceae bacterium]
MPPLAEAREVGRAKSAFLSAGQKTLQTEQALAAGLAEFQQEIAPVLKKSCVECHGPEKAKAKFRVDTLDPDLVKGGDVDWWLEVLDVLSNGEMPPEDADVHLSKEDLGKVVEWLNGQIQKASTARRNEGGHSSFRRMARYEYGYALQDLLGLSYSLADSLPPETASEDGFKNSSEILQMSGMQFEMYREIGLKALKHATVIGDRSEMVVYRLPGQEAENVHALTQKLKKGQPQPTEVSLDRRKSSVKFNLSNHLPDEGIMRVTLRAGRTTMKPDEFVSLRLVFSAHTSNNANFSQVVSEGDVQVTASDDKPELIHFDIPLSEIQRNPFRKNKTNFPRRDEFLTIESSISTHGKEPLEVVMDFIEVSAPHYEQWPPAGHGKIFFESKDKGDEQKYGREVLARFMERAWRRPVAAEEVEPFLNLFAEYRPEFASFEETMLEVLATVLASPEFLYLTQRETEGGAKEPREITEVELASRLSFFLWSSIPDEKLLDLAKQGTLSKPEVLEAQVERMLADPRGERFANNFVQQWLGLDGMSSVTHMKDKSLMAAMEEEPIAFFKEVLAGNNSVMDFLHSDYVVVNESLARHYRIADVYGPRFRKVAVKADLNRGGILTNAAILTMNSDGKDSHPLKRGIWMLERVLHDPPPPAPPNVPEVDLTDPRILEMTLKERIADHRNKPACISCHAKIDPWGIAFENYDALGSYRTEVNNKPVDASAKLFNKQELAGMDGLKRYLLAERQDQFARAMVHKMTSYALGRSLNFSDHAEIDELVGQFRKKNDRLGDLIHLIARSSIFNSKS